MKYSTKVTISRRQQHISMAQLFARKHAWAKSLPLHIQVQFQPNKPNEPETVITKQTRHDNYHTQASSVNTFRHMANCSEGHR